MPVLPTIQRHAIRKFRDGSAGPWGAIAVAAVGLRVMQRVGTRRDEVVYREVLKPGHEVLITHTPDSRLQVARADKRAEKQAKADAKAAKSARRAAKRSRGAPPA